jgi:hypothetical protein
VSTEDYALILEAYQDKLAEWNFRELAWWPQEEIPDMAFSFVADQIAEIVSTPFGRSAPVVSDEGGEQVSIGERGRRGIRRLIQKEKTGQPVQACYF